MDMQDLEYFNSLLSDYQISDLPAIAEKAKELYRQAIEEEVYQKYEPKVYKRTNQLKDNIGIKIEGGVIFIYSDRENMHYHSVFSGEEVSAYIPIIMNEGRGNQGISDYDYFYNYSARYFLEKAREKIIKELGCECVVVKEDIYTDLNYQW